MKINHSEYTISELVEMFKRKELIINRAYQRGSSVWPKSAKSYFIDTILEGFPFPKIYIYQEFDSQARKPIKEVVDGQQRLTTIQEFLTGELRLTSVSEKYSGFTFAELDNVKQMEFLMYSVPADVILAAERTELLEMFRRINSYTAPLNPAEKRHADFNGELKWFIIDQADRYSPILQKYGVLSELQIIRMGDAELLAEFLVALESGIVHKSTSSLRSLYQKYDEHFPARDKYEMILRGFFECLQTELQPLRNSFMMKPYAFHSLFCAVSYLRHGLPDVEGAVNIPPIRDTFQISRSAVARLLSMAEAHEIQDVSGPYADYVKACLGTTTKFNQRTARTLAIVREILRSPN